ncbi:ribose 1,5-bisphosphate isomerase [Desulfurococcus mucosus]|uniref:Ribose 1,5-bisphosphate isomerase n=1 Tax=Desulfurococcus mucosus (strain ATCC 35584 / DSM 2162 / JCM 9187 / O7/1) TaxID=765177 RepID=E8R945_DESM0|nr:ribose 1,5-bisphosphate isomerase [Desulfurococcus mucosus]ADV65021.1 ribose 1,5-bisphosphate isomerase [Desulfurococcus mucosus DSM 2162]
MSEAGIPPRVLEIAEGIRSMKIRGAGKIGRAAAEALKIAAEEYAGPRDLQVFKKYIGRVADILISTRPTAVSLPNAVMFVVSALKNAQDYESARSSIIGSANRFIEESLSAVKKISEMAARRIKENSIVLTHCHSSVAVSTITEAYRQGRVVKVYSTETRPFYQGRITATQLINNGVPVVQIPDSAVRYVMGEVDYVVIGADTVASNGAVVNKIGTSQVALAAKEARVRVYVVAESYKFSPVTLVGELVPIEFRDPTEVVPEDWLKQHPGVKVLNPSFDVTPPEYIDAIVTEIGVIPPQAAILVLMERLGWALEKIKQGVSTFTSIRFEDLLE